MTHEVGRARYYERIITARQLDAFHVTQREVGEFFLTESAFPSGFKLPKHSHRYHCIYIVLKGGFIETQGSKSRRRKPLDVVLTPFDQPHADNFDDSGGRCFIVEIPTRWTESIRDYTAIFDDSAELSGDSMSWLMMRLYKESRNLDRFSPLVTEGILLEIMAMASRCFKETIQRKPPPWLVIAEGMLREQLSESLTLSYVASSVGVHPVYLASTFRKYHGRSIGERVRRLRIEYACHVLGASDAPITDIALEAGFADHSHLCKTFKKLTGLTPAEYRALMRRS
ncbi:MAG TPA: helix-turn-helix domain-containing protein [Pyrinomonadaceae bacterium]|jgi:AraC family transcriptional regulator|nr:helix-turn-helix domain-containing protein [Pyrinomonadaceae bacterium]